jgi:hypothetical protein
MTKFLLFLLLAMSTSPALANCSSSAQPDQETIRTLLKNALAPHIHTLNRKVYFYSWMSYNPNSSAIDYFKTHSGPGEGIFGAADPLSSVDFGNNGGDGALLRIGVPAGVRYLDEGVPFEFKDLYSFRIERGSFPASAADSAIIRCYDQSAPQGMKAQDLALSVYKDFQTAFSIDSWRASPYHDCANGTSADSEVIFSDPAFSGQFELTLLHKFDSPEAMQDEAYANTLRYFDMFDFATDNTSDGRANGFWVYYKAWAPNIDHIAAGTDLSLFQKNRSKQLSLQRKELVNGIFGCSENPEYQEEVPTSGVGDETITQIAHFLSEESFDAANALVEFGKRAVPALIAAVKTGNATTQSHACYALSRIDKTLADNLSCPLSVD